MRRCPRDAVDWALFKRSDDAQTAFQRQAGIGPDGSHAKAEHPSSSDGLTRRHTLHDLTA